ncbi:hypothetical protein PVAP13_5KG154307 [Panicum virgatum]|uniref:Uncharacterized protein n=1 Tax=Panicum virgatum TaxID=38727 RepID=A0A8T0SGX3_PANVG|nr:hypothetical protein PVAP13_5KG154307 [Panicum virgatum]
MKAPIARQGAGLRARPSSFLGRALILLHRPPVRQKPPVWWIASSPAPPLRPRPSLCSAYVSPQTPNPPFHLLPLSYPLLPNPAQIWCFPFELVRVGARGSSDLQGREGSAERVPAKWV